MHKGVENGTLLRHYDYHTYSLAQELLKQPGPKTIAMPDGLVLGHTISLDGRDTMFYTDEDADGLVQDWSPLVGQVVLGNKLSRLTDLTDVDNNQVLLLRALEPNAEEPREYVAVEVDKVGLDGLKVYCMNNLPTGMQFFSPNDYLGADGASA